MICAGVLSAGLKLLDFGGGGDGTLGVALGTTKTAAESPVRLGTCAEIGGGATGRAADLLGTTLIEDGAGDSNSVFTETPGLGLEVGRGAGAPNNSLLQPLLEAVGTGGGELFAFLLGVGVAVTASQGIVS